MLHTTTHASPRSIHYYNAFDTHIRHINYCPRGKLWTQQRMTILSLLDTYCISLSSECIESTNICARCVYPVSGGHITHTQIHILTYICTYLCAQRMWIIVCFMTIRGVCHSSRIVQRRWNLYYQNWLPDDEDHEVVITSSDMALSECRWTHSALICLCFIYFCSILYLMFYLLIIE